MVAGKKKSAKKKRKTAEADGDGEEANNVMLESIGMDCLNDDSSEDE